MMKIYSSNITRRMIRSGHLLDPPSIGSNPFKPTDHEILTGHLPSGNVLGIASDAELLEGISRKLLQDDFDEYWSIAEKQVNTNNQTFNEL